MIGVITSPTGAVIRDILHRLADRFPRHVLVWPVRVQGDGSAEEVAAAIRGFNALPRGRADPRPDLLIVARGGGSLEDLWSFNDEIVVRAAAASMIPLISAVGHETDVTLIDFAADKRAPTPTAAAEMGGAGARELRRQVDGLARRSLACWQRGQEARRTELRAPPARLPTAEALSRCRASGSTRRARLPRALIANAQIHHTAILARRRPARSAALRARMARCCELVAALVQRARTRRERVAPAGANGWRPRRAALGGLRAMPTPIATASRGNASASPRSPNAASARHDCCSRALDVSSAAGNC